MIIMSDDKNNNIEKNNNSEDEVLVWKTSPKKNIEMYKSSSKKK